MSFVDLNGDGRGDIIWRNTSTGAVINWLGQPDGGFLSNPDAGVDTSAVGRLVGTGDFNADGRSDTLWKEANGNVFLSLTYPDGAHFFGWSMGFVANVPNVWHVAGTGDFNGDGADDVLWRHDDGTITDWLGHAGSFIGNLAKAGYSVDLAWQVAGIGDFNGDGRDDILWRNDNGTITNWLGQEDGTFFGNLANAYYSIDPSWQVAGTGDFNGDGRDDVLWRNDDGTITDWLGEPDGSFHGNLANASYPVDPSWRVAGTGDYNGDGRDDVLWRHADGTVTNWLGQTDATFIGNFANAASPMDGAWQIQPNPTGAGEWDYF